MTESQAASPTEMKKLSEKYLAGKRSWERGFTVIVVPDEFADFLATSSVVEKLVNYKVHFAVGSWDVTIKEIAIAFKCRELVVRIK